MPSTTLRKRESYWKRLQNFEESLCTTTVSTTYLISTVWNRKTYIITSSLTMTFGRCSISFHSYRLRLEDSVVLRFCPKICNKKEPCLRKCCPYGQHFEYDEDTGYDTCVDSVVKERNRKINVTVDGQEVIMADESDGFRYISGGEYGVIDCQHQEVVKISTEFSGALIKEPFTFHVEDGRPFYFDKERQTWTEFENVENHCFERVITRTGDGDVGEDADVLFLCIHNRSSVSTSGVRSLGRFA